MARWKQKGKPFPAGVMQFAMWDINEPVIYIKSLNPMGIPNPLRKIHYRMEEMQNTSQSGTANLMSGEEEKKDTTQYVGKDELQSMKEEIMQAIREIKTEGIAKKQQRKGNEHESFSDDYRHDESYADATGTGCYAESITDSTTVSKPTDDDTELFP